MPKDPIKSREIFYEVLRDGSFRLTDWALVNTSLGAMLEARSNVAVGPVSQRDPYDDSFTKMSQVDNNVFMGQFGGGRLWPTTFNTQ